MSIIYCMVGLFIKQLYYRCTIITHISMSLFIMSGGDLYKIVLLIKILFIWESTESLSQSRQPLATLAELLPLYCDYQFTMMAINTQFNILIISCSCSSFVFSIFRNVSSRYICLCLASSCIQSTFLLQDHVLYLVDQKGRLCLHSVELVVSLVVK